VIEAGVKVIDAPFVAHGNVATAGGCLASQYLATWMITRGASMRDAEEAMHYVAPVGEKALYVNQAVSVVAPSSLERRFWRLDPLGLATCNDDRPELRYMVRTLNCALSMSIGPKSVPALERMRND